MEWKDPVARLYARIAAEDPAAEDARPTRSPLWVGTAAALGACFAVALACGPASNDDVIMPTNRSRVEGAGCDVGDDGGIQVAGNDDSCSLTGTTGGTSASAGGATSSGSGTGTGSGSGTTTAALPPPAADAGVDAGGPVL